jgi:hypothetical protein
MLTTLVEDTVREIAAWVTPRQIHWVTVAVGEVSGRARAVAPRKVVPPRRYPFPNAHKPARRRREFWRKEVAGGEVAVLAF